MIRQLIFLLCILLLAITACSDDTNDSSEQPQQGTDAADSITVDTHSADSIDGDSQIDMGTPEEPRVPFDLVGPFGYGFRDTAGPFTLDTDQGSWSIEENWTGRDSYFFFVFTDDPAQSTDLTSMLEDLWYTVDGRASTEIEALLDLSRENTHYFFASFDSDAAVDMARLRSDLNLMLASLTPEEEAYWEQRLHVVTEPVWRDSDWFGQFTGDTGTLWFAIDPFQKLRQLAFPQDVIYSTYGLRYFGYESQYLAFELERQEAMEQESYSVVTVFTDQTVGNAYVDIELPDADEMQSYDTMFFDMGAYCGEHDDDNCGEWDYLSNMYICDQPEEVENPHVDTLCQPYIAPVTEVIEVMGTCVVLESECEEDEDCDDALTCDGYLPEEDEVEEVMGRCISPESSCATDDACSEDSLACDGYIAPVDPVEVIIADTLPCACVTPLGESLEYQYTCNGDGAGYGDCPCACGTEIGRWITTYGREGRWVTDVSPMLSMFSRGGTQTLHMVSGNAYDMEFDILLTNRGKGGHQSEYQFLFGGGSFNESYNATREPITFEVPDDVTRVELTALITGHGWGAEVENCAEFCNHTHHFTVNGTEYIRSHPWTEVSDGCLQQIDRGVVPNQYGTWPYGRGGWCPGLDVVPWVVDITDVLVPGENTISYVGLFEGADYVPVPSNSGVGFGANINMSSYLIFWRE